jgi:hypothetical protein
MSLIGWSTERGSLRSQARNGNKEGQGCRAHGFPLFGPQCPPPLGEPTAHVFAPRDGNGRLCCTTTPRSSHISGRQLVYIKEKNTSFFLNQKLKKFDKNWLRKLRSKSTSWGRNMRAAASPLAGRFLSVLSVPSRLSNAERAERGAERGDERGAERAKQTERC